MPCLLGRLFVHPWCLCRSTEKSIFMLLTGATASLMFSRAGSTGVSSQLQLSPLPSAPRGRQTEGSTRMLCTHPGSLNVYICGIRKQTLGLS